MNLDRLHEFERIAETGSLTAASGQLGVSVATLSSRLRSFESSLGIQLFEREGKALLLTDAGRCLLGNAGDILARYRMLTDDLKALTEHRYERLNIAIDAPFPLHLGPLLDKLNLANPDMVLRLLDMNSLNIWESLKDGSVDVGFLTATESTIPDGFDKRLIAGPSQYVVLPAGHPLSNRASVSLAELEGETFLLYGKSSNAPARAFQTSNLEASGIRFSVYDQDIVQSAIQFLVPIGKGILITPYYLIDIPSSVQLPLTDTPFPALPWLIASRNPGNSDVPRFIRDYFTFAKANPVHLIGRKGVEA